MEHVLTDIPEGKIYKTNTIAIATFFGGIFVAAFLIASNFKTFGDSVAARRTWLYSILVFILLIVTAFIPFFDKIPGLVYNIAIFAAASGLAKKYQGNLIEDHLEKGGLEYSAGRAFLITILGLILTLAILLIPFLLSDIFEVPVE